MAAEIVSPHIEVEAAVAGSRASPAGASLSGMWRCGRVSRPKRRRDRGRVRSDARAGLRRAGVLRRSPPGARPEPRGAGRIGRGAPAANPLQAPRERLPAMAQRPVRPHLLQRCVSHVKEERAEDLLPVLVASFSFTARLIRSEIYRPATRSIARSTIPISHLPTHHISVYLCRIRGRQPHHRHSSMPEQSSSVYPCRIRGRLPSPLRGRHLPSPQDPAPSISSSPDAEH